MTVLVYNASAEAGANAIANKADDGAGAGSIEIRSGTRPAVNGALTGTLLVDIVLGDPAFGVAAGNGVRALKTANGLPIVIANAAATGTAGYGALVDSNGVVILTGTVGVGTGDFQLQSLSITINQEVTLTAFTFELPQA
ncbi:MAG: hypothetical protein ACR2QH_15095 [Geminicoccaceae bacterium]